MYKNCDWQLFVLKIQHCSSLTTFFKKNFLLEKEVENEFSTRTYIFDNFFVLFKQF